MSPHHTDSENWRVREHSVPPFFAFPVVEELKPSRFELPNERVEEENSEKKRTSPGIVPPLRRSLSTPMLLPSKGGLSMEREEFIELQGHPSVLKCNVGLPWLCTGLKDHWESVLGTFVVLTLNYYLHSKIFKPFVLFEFIYYFYSF